MIRKQMVAFDSTILSILLLPDAELHHAGQTVDHARERVTGLVRALEAAQEQILVPVPALCEVLVAEGVDAQDVLSALGSSAFVRFGDFDERAAIELAARLHAAIQAGDPNGDRNAGLTITKTAMTFAQQIVAISLVNGARVLYSDDDAVETFAVGCGLAVTRVADLPLPAIA